MNLKREVAMSSGKAPLLNDAALDKAPLLHDAALDEDVCMEILLCLPIKSVIKFQTVCKQWLSLISSDHFRRLHTLRHHQPPPCVILKTPEQRLCHFNLIRKPTMMIPFSSINIPCGYSKIFSSSNGLVILYRWNDNYFHVYNPITKQSRKICFVSLITDSSSYCVKMLHLVFNSKSLHYKVVCIWGPSGAPLPDRNDYKMEVFDSEKGTWKAGMDPITVSSTLVFFNCTYCNNNIYGVNYTRDGYRSLYCIDIDNNVVRFFTNPTVGMLERLAYGESIQEWNGCLYYSTLLWSVHSGHSALLWELEDDKWSLKHEDRLPFLAQWSYVMLLRFIPLTSTLIVVLPPTKFIAYSFLEKTYTELPSLQIEYEVESIHVFHHTLAPV